MAREHWGSRLGFVLSAVGMAVGFGNIVRFPSLVAHSGGAAFVAVYLAVVVLVGVPGIMAEILIGREGRGDPIASYGRLGGPRWRPVGVAVVAATLFFMAFYVVLNGYVALYLLGSVASFPIADPVETFVRREAGPATLGATLLVVAAGVGVVSLGVRKGLERAALVMMPLLLILLVGLAAYGLAQPGAREGLAFYLRPRPEALTMGTLAAALGQAFFSLGVGLGALIAYGSYLQKGSDVPADATLIAGGDTLVALLAGFMVFPLLFSLGLQSAVTADDVNAFAVLFVTLPSAFARIGGALGASLQTAFFLALFFAAFTSTIALMEVPVAALTDRFGVSRRKATILVGEIVAGLSILPALSAAALGWMDRLTATVALPLAAIAGAVFVGYRLRGAADALERGARVRMGRLLVWWLRSGIPLIVGFILVWGLADLAGLA